MKIFYISIAKRHIARLYQINRHHGKLGHRLYSHRFNAHFPGTGQLLLQFPEHAE